jgi:hypothetical protein
MLPQKHLSNFIDNFILNTCEEIQPTIIDEYRKLNEKCDFIILRIKQRKEKSYDRS